MKHQKSYNPSPDGRVNELWLLGRKFAAPPKKRLKLLQKRRKQKRRELEITYKKLYYFVTFCIKCFLTLQKWAKSDGICLHNFVGPPKIISVSGVFTAKFDGIFRKVRSRNCFVPTIFLRAVMKKFLGKRKRDHYLIIFFGAPLRGSAIIS